jgi:hypothetical protein
MLSCTVLRLYSVEKSGLYQLDRRLGGPDQYTEGDGPMKRKMKLRRYTLFLSCVQHHSEIYMGRYVKHCANFGSPEFKPLSGNQQITMIK